MPNIFRNIPVPVSNGLGASVSLADMGPGRTFTVDNGDFSGNLIIQASDDNVNFSDIPGASFSSGGQLPLTIVAAFKFARIRRFNTQVPGTPLVAVGAQQVGSVDVLYGTLNVPAGNGVGTATDLSAGGNLLTLLSSDSNQGTLTVEGSEDGGVSFSPVTDFNTGEFVTIQSGTFSQLRVRRAQTPAGATLPVVSFGSMLAGAASSGIAFWSQTIVRYFLLDYDGGSDANLGYIDAAINAVLAPAGIAIKTVDRLMQILPKIGNNRMTCILIKPRAAGANYLNQDGSQSALDFTGFSGWSTIVRRGSTDLTNSATDKILCGAMTALAGPNGDGSFSCLAGATTSFFSVAAGLTAEPGIIGFRIRFTGNVTPALANAVAMVWRNTATDITPSDNLPAAPAVGDTFFIERPGVRFLRYKEVDFNQNAGGSRTFKAISIAACGLGLTSGGTDAFVFGGGGLSSYAFIDQIGAAGLFFSNSNYGRGYNIINTYADESLTNRNVGVGLRAESPGLLTGSEQVIISRSAFVNAANRTTIVGTIIGNIGSGSYFGIGPTLQASGNLPGPLAGPDNVIRFGSGVTAAIRGARVVTGGVLVQCGNWAFTGAVFDACALPCVKITGQGCNVSIDNCSNGVGGNTDVVVDATLGFGCNITYGTETANTVTGAAGQARVIMAGANVIKNTVDLLTTDWSDGRYNRWLGTFGSGFMRAAIGAWFDVPVVTSGTQPAGNPPAGFVRIWYESDTNMMGSRNSAGATVHSPAFT